MSTHDSHPKAAVAYVVLLITIFSLASATETRAQELQDEIPQIDIRTLGMVGDPVIPWVVNAITSEGDSASRADVARQTFGVNGSGVTVGVISDSYANNGANVGLANAAVTAGELPGPSNPNGFLSPVVVVNDDSGTDEGRAMLEIIHDLAPGANLKFHSAFNNSVGPASGQTIANAINALVADGVDVIVDDVGVLSQPFFQDGPAAIAANAANAAGVAYFSSAGNSGTEAWSAEFKLSAASWNEFDGNQNESGDQALNLDLPAGGRVTVEWDDPYPSLGAPGVASNFDVGLWDFATGDFVSVGLNDQSAGADPFEIVGVSVAGQYGLVIQHSGGPMDKILKAKVFGGNIIDDDDTDSPTVHGHAAAEGAVAVAAQFHGEADSVESFSSVGPTDILFDAAGNRINTLRPTAMITAPDGVRTSVSGFDPFFGTSAAAPHAAAVAALVLERANQLNVSLTVAKLYDILFQTAVDIEAPGFDNSSGHGRIDAAAALAALIQGDFDLSGILDVSDIDALTLEAVGTGNNPLFDLNNDEQVNQEDRRIWVEELRFTFFGDSNLDDEFNSTDLIVVLQAGQYEDGIIGNSTWASGDWNGDLDFTSSDFIQAFQGGGFEQGPRAMANAVPEPSGFLLMLLALCLPCVGFHSAK